MEQQQSSQMLNESPPVLIPNISTEQIQKCLEENTQLILFILESQRLGRHNECEMHTAKLQSNLTFLSNLADVMSQPPQASQPPPKPIPPQILGAGPTKPPGHWSRDPEAAPPVPRQPQIQLNDDENQIQQGYQQHQLIGFGTTDYNNFLGI